MATNKDSVRKLTDKAQDRVNPDKLIELAETEGIELSDEQMDAISGGAVWEDDDDGEKIYVITHETGCGGTFETTTPHPAFCQLCGGEMYWSN